MKHDVPLLAFLTASLYACLCGKWIFVTLCLGAAVMECLVMGRVWKRRYAARETHQGSSLKAARPASRPNKGA